MVDPANDTNLSSSSSLSKVNHHNNNNNINTNNDTNDTDTTTKSNNINTNTRIIPISNIENDEIHVRTKLYHHDHSIYLLCLNTYSSIFIFLYYLISLEGILSIVLSVGLTIYVYYAIENKYDDNDTTFDGSIMSWTLLSFAVITPIGAAVTMAFRRREHALVNISLLRSTFIELYTSYSIWGWDYIPGNTSINGRTKSSVNWLDHSDVAMREILYICDDVTRLLTLPSHTRARHKTTHCGRSESKQIHIVHERFMESIIVRFGHLAEICEVLKREGLPPNESNRIRQWENHCLNAIERLRVIKIYRTPQGLRSFGRLFSMFLPPFYAPYYAQLAHDIHSLGTAIAFSIFTALALTSLFETISQMEDPFIKASVLDGVDVQKDLIDQFKPQLLALRKRYFPGCPPFDDGIKSR